MDLRDLRIFHAGASAVIALMCDVLYIQQIIDNVIHWDPAQCRLSPGTRVKALLINLLVNRQALYHVVDFFKEQDMEVLFGKEEQVKAEELNDDALGRTLDKLAVSDLRTIFSSIALNAAATHDASIQRMHMDTTSISVQGAYEGQGDLDITFGYSKDHRPDLKQFMIGLTVTEDGLPILGHSLNGNTSDKTWYPKVIEELTACLKADQIKEITFVADSALITADNLNLLAAKHLQFVSLLPETFSVVEKVKQEAFQLGAWHTIGTLSQKKDAASYKSQSFTRDIYERPYRLLVVHSTALDKRKEKSLIRKWQKQTQELETASSELSMRPFACEADAQKAIELLIREHRHQPFILHGQVLQETHTKHAGKGRPRKGTQPQSTVAYRASVTVMPDEKAMGDERELASTFVLITSRLDVDTHPDIEVLRAYKEQNAVEKQFSFLKKPFLLGPIFLKNKDRVAAMSFVFQLALLVAAYLEYRIRQSMKQEKTPLILLGNRKSTAPTARAILEMFDRFLVVKKGKERVLINHHGPEVIRALKLIGFCEEIYTSTSP